MLQPNHSESSFNQIKVKQKLLKWFESGLSALSNGNGIFPRRKLWIPRIVNSNSQKTTRRVVNPNAWNLSSILQFQLLFNITFKTWARTRIVFKFKWKFHQQIPLRVILNVFPFLRMFALSWKQFSFVESLKLNVNEECTLCNLFVLKLKTFYLQDFIAHSSKRTQTYY